MRFAIHLALHVLVPGAVAGVFWRGVFWRAWAVMVATNLIDLDHLLATPILDPNRCSVPYHPLHSWPALAIYVALLAFRPTRLVAIGLLTHVALDGVDCVFMG